MDKAYNSVLKQWLKSTLDINPNDLSYYVIALTHRSYANEHNLNYSYQRLEYLGDSILGYLVAEYLFNKYKNEDEGYLTIVRKKMIQSKAEAYAAKSINLQNFILFGHGMKNHQDIDKILEDCFESLIGAIYLDQGIKEVKKLLYKTLFMFEGQDVLEEAIDYKTLVQEALVKHNTKNALYHTKQINKDSFESILQADGIVYGRGSGHNKKIAQTNAAKDAYSKLVIKKGK